MEIDGEGDEQAKYVVLYRFSHSLAYSKIERIAVLTSSPRQ